MHHVITSSKPGGSRWQQTKPESRSVVRQIDEAAQHVVPGSSQEMERSVWNRSRATGRQYLITPIGVSDSGIGLRRLSREARKQLKELARNPEQDAQEKPARRPICRLERDCFETGMASDTRSSFRTMDFCQRKNVSQPECRRPSHHGPPLWRAAVLWTQARRKTEESQVNARTKKVRCAIYTRKSHEEGLDQEFNSLDAQRSAAESYIQSQVHEGWKASPRGTTMADSPAERWSDRPDRADRRHSGRQSRLRGRLQGRPPEPVAAGLLPG